MKHPPRPYADHSVGQRRDRDRYRDDDRYNDRRRDDDYYHSHRRDRSRDRRRSPPRVERDRRDRSRDRARDQRPLRRDDSRDRKRRRDDSTESRSKRRKEDDRNSFDNRPADARARDVSRCQLNEKAQIINATQSARGAVTPKQGDEKSDRLAKLEAWKRKQAEKTKQESQAKFSLTEMDKSAASPSTTLTPTASTPQSPITPIVEPKSPAPPTVRYDPKNLTKKATTNAATSAALGADLEIPKTIKVSADVDSSATTVKANTQKASFQNGTGKSVQGQKCVSLTNLHLSDPSKGGLLKAKGNVGGFGLGQKQQDSDKSTNKLGVDFDDEEDTRKKLEKLPTPPPDTLTNGDTAHANDTEDVDAEDEDVDMAEADNEEEAAAAARAAAEKREERLLEQSQAENVETNDTTGDGDTTMQDAQNAEAEISNAPVEEEEDDPLDAFMSGLTDTKAPGLAPKKGASKKQAPATMFENDENDLEAVQNGDEFADIANKAKKRKDIPTVNHATMNYESVRKSFYVEPSELASLTDDEVSALRFELDGIKVRGVDVPKPVQKWSQCGLGVQSLEVIQKMGFEKPTSIQSQALPAIMSGRDIIGVAKTGSGKTLAFLLPMFRHIKDQRPLENMDGPIGLILSPTRELATQIHKECRPWLKALGLRAVCAYGGAPIKEQIAELKRGAEIVVCTPGRMIEMLAANGGRVTNLRRVTYTVLDEADRMFDMGFEPQVIKIMANVRPERQTVLFSATFPRNMEALARKALVKPIEIIVGGRSVVAPEIKQVVEVRPENTKFLRLLQLLGEIHEDEEALSLIFVDRQESAEDLMAAIMKRGYPSNTLHGGKDQFDRDSVISDFKAGIFPVLVATSVAARGLDVKQLKMVVNFDCPNHLEDYVHRSGRTGRAGNTGLAVTFITEAQERYSIDIAKALKQSGQEIPADLQKLVDSINEKIKAGKAQAAGFGFGGKGLDRLDRDRDAAKARWTAEVDGVEAPKTEETEEFKLKREGEPDEEKIEVKPAGTTATPVKPEVVDEFGLDAKVQVHKREVEVPSTKNKTDLVSERIAAINARLRKGGELRGNAPIDNKGPDAGAFHSTFEINDLPQKARWAVTNRTNVAKILDATGTSITTKGNFYAAGQVPGANELPKLYILVEGDTEVVVTNAVSELRRLAKDGMMAAINTEARAPASGRYTVV